MGYAQAACAAIVNAWIARRTLWTRTGPDGVRYVILGAPCCGLCARASEMADADGGKRVMPRTGRGERDRPGATAAPPPARTQPSQVYVTRGCASETHRLTLE